MDFPGLNPVRWILLTTAGLAGAAAAKAGGGMIAVAGYAVAAIAAAGILWLLFAPTLVPRDVTVFGEGVFDHPDGKYEHGYTLSVASCQVTPRFPQLTDTQFPAESPGVSGSWGAGL